MIENAATSTKSDEETTRVLTIIDPNHISLKSNASVKSKQKEEFTVKDFEIIKYMSFLSEYKVYSFLL